MNRQQKRAAAAQARKHATPGRLTYHEAIPDVAVRGFAMLAHAVNFRFPDNTPRGRCLLRALVGFEVAHQSGIEAHVEIGSMLYRVGPDPARDIVAYCGKGNAGYDLEVGAIFHSWLAVGDYILDLSAIDWPAIDFCTDDPTGRSHELGPVRWTIKAPPVLWAPRDDLMSAWQPNGTPEIGRAWYGPFVGDAERRGRVLDRLWNEDGEKIAHAVKLVTDKAALNMSDYEPYEVTPHALRFSVVTHEMIRAHGR